MVNNRIIALSNQLREDGVTVSIRSTQTACDVWDLIKDSSNLNDMRTALKSVYIKDPHDEKKFNEAFNDLFVKKHDEMKADKANQQMSKNNQRRDDPSIKPEDIMPSLDSPEATTSIQAMIPPDINPDEIRHNRIHQKDLLKADISAVNSFDERVLDLCRKLGAKIANQRTKRRKRMNSNYIDMPRTIRGNLKNGGKLIKLYNSKPQIRKSRHVFLSDVSGSCDWISSWFFAIIYGCQNSFDKISSFEFDSQVIETTSYLKSESYLDSFENITLQRMKRGMLHGQSDMASSFRDFLKQAHLTHRSDVIILTDCRDWRGKREDGVLESATVLREIVTKSNKVMIFNPEKKIRWNTPTSCVKDYENAGAEVFEIGNLDNLANMITRL